MPIYEYYCRENHTIYQFFAKSLAQGRTMPKCPHNAAFKLEKMVSSFAVKTGGAKAGGDEGAPVAGEERGARGESGEDARMEAAMGAMESEFTGMDENDPRAMGRMMRRMAELTGEKIDGEMEEVVRKLEEGADPESLEDQLGGGGGEDEEAGGGGYGEGGAAGADGSDPKEPRQRIKVRRAQPRRDPQLYDYE